MRHLWILLLGWLAVFGACSHDPNTRVAKDLDELITQTESTDFNTCRGDRFTVDFADALDALPDDTPDAQREQLRDWLFTAALSRVAHQASDKTLLASLADQPIRRDNSLGHLLHTPVGPARAATASDGLAVVLVDRAASQGVMDAVMEAVDEQAFHAGALPARALVLGYDLDFVKAQAEVCTLGNVDRAWMVSPASGHREAAIRAAGDLATFLNGGVDLLGVDFTGGVLHARGRVRARAKGAPMTVGHVAELASSATLSYVPLAKLGPAVSRVSAANRAEARSAAAELDRALRVATHAQILSGATGDERRFLSTLLEWKQANPDVPTEELLLSLRFQFGHEGQRGFSLDPRTDVEAARQALAEIAAAFPDEVKLVALLQRWDADPDTALALTAVAGDPQDRNETRRAIAELQRKLRGANAFDAEGALIAAQTGASRLPRSLAKVILARARYQCARYDGPFQGTLTGMTYFYTDLVAKLWGLDYRGSAPEHVVPGFASVVNYDQSAAYCQEEEKRPFTRIWFGARDEAFARPTTGGVRFGPGFARLFAKGSAQGPEHSEEDEPKASMLRFIRWWDTNYAKVAEWEPQYELLNQLLKWSAALAAADAEGARGSLAFAANVPVDHSLRFDRWLQRHPELRWQGPLELLDKPNEPTECIALLQSEPFNACGRAIWLAGGIGAPGKADILKKTVSAPPPAVHIGRLSAEAKPVLGAAGEIRVDNVARRGGALKDVEIKSTPTSLSAEAKLDSKLSQRGDSLFWDTAKRPVKWAKSLDLDTKLNRLVGREAVNDFGVAQLQVDDIRSAAPKLKVSSQELAPEQVARQIVDRMAHDHATFADSVRTLAVEREVLDLSEGRFAVRVSEDKGARKVYAVMSSGGGNNGPPSSTTYVLGAHSRDGRSAKAAIRVSLVDGDHALAQYGAKRIQSGEPSVRALLDKGDYTAAKAIAEAANAKPRVIASVTKAALENGRLDDARGLVGRLVQQKASIVDRQDVVKAIARADVRLARAGASPEQRAALADMTMRLAIREPVSPKLGQRYLDAAQRSGHSPGAVYAPESWPSSAALPPAYHAPGTPLPPEQRYVSRVINASVSIRSAPREVEVGAAKLGFRPGTAGAPRGGGGFIGPAMLLLGGDGCDDRDRDAGACDEKRKDRAWPVVAVVPCSVETKRSARGELPACHGDGMDGLGAASTKQLWKAVIDLTACSNPKQCEAAKARYRELSRNIEDGQ